VTIGPEVLIDRIAGHGVVIYPGCKIFGKDTLILAGAKLGYEGPVTVENCQIGPNVTLGGGYFRNSVFLEQVNVGLGSLVRDACILEEQASAAHCVGLKQTILFPFVTLGSLINFCDCLMAGGTSRKNHSEVGSSYIHFNYTPNQDKATPSLIGDVPRGVMLDQRPIFLGGQGGMVGPVRIEYGTVIAAGLICRKDLPDSGRLLVAPNSPPEHRNASELIVDFHPGIYWHVHRKVLNNIHYIANLVALLRWYKYVRSLFLGHDPLCKALYEGAVHKLELSLAERIQKLKDLSYKMPESISKYRALVKGEADDRLISNKNEFYRHWQQLEDMFREHATQTELSPISGEFLEDVQKRSVKDGQYITVIQGLDNAERMKGITWLQGIVTAIDKDALRILPSFRI
jgi:hypothetical protein